MGFARLTFLIALFCSLAALASGPSTRPEELSAEIGARIERVPEFRFIEAEAKRLGVRAWLFGGTAAGFAHYVKWDTLREKGDTRFQPDRFDYDYSNIYRSNQDLDIVIDGDPAKAKALQQSLQNSYPHLQGSKTLWEVRLLSQDMGDKQALLNNPDFLNQHTDSNSTGMIELTPPKNNEPRVRDLRDWTSSEPFFLRDVSEGTLHYYYSPSHESTQFAREGRNPPILSVIRYFTKAFQYELAIKPEDLRRIQEIVSKFDPADVSPGSYVSTWIGKNGKKLVQNAVNIEYAVNVLDQVGLRRKLASMGDPAKADSLAWWMNKEPLRSEPVGKGAGKTAREVFLEKGWSEPGRPLTVAHETNNFLAYESITRAHTGDPNVLISRENAVGETAAFGNGFYTRAGREGARGTGLTIRFEIDPNAREGSDFTVASPDYLVWRNKKALRVIPESLKLGPVEYFELLASDPKLGGADRGILEMLQRRMQNRVHALSPDEKRKIAEIARANLRGDAPSGALLVEWLQLGLDREFPDVAGRNPNALYLRFLVRGKQPPAALEKLVDPSIQTALDRNGAISDELAEMVRHAFTASNGQGDDPIDFLRKELSSEKPSRKALAAWFYGGFADRDPGFFGPKEFYRLVEKEPQAEAAPLFSAMRAQLAKRLGAEALSRLSILEDELKRPNPSWPAIQLWLESADPDVARKLVAEYFAQNFEKLHSAFVAAIWCKAHDDQVTEQLAKGLTPIGYFETMRLPPGLNTVFHWDSKPTTPLPIKMAEIRDELAAGKVNVPASRIEAMVEEDVAASLPNWLLYESWLARPESLSRPDLMLKILYERGESRGFEGRFLNNPIWKPFFQEAAENILLHDPASFDLWNPAFARELKRIFSEPLKQHGSNRPALTAEEIKTIAAHLAASRPKSNSEYPVRVVTSPSGPNGLRIMKEFFKQKPNDDVARVVGYNFYHPSPEISEVAKEIFELPDTPDTIVPKYWAFTAVENDHSPWVEEALLRYSRSQDKNLRSRAFEGFPRFPGPEERQIVLEVLKNGGQAVEDALKASVILPRQDFLFWNQHYSSGRWAYEAVKNLKEFPNGPPQNCEEEFEHLFPRQPQ